MQSYMESKLTGLHYSGLKSQFFQKLTVAVCGISIAVALPYLHIGIFYYIWAPDKPAVDRMRCTCDCFDTVFRGRYEWPPSSYKHFYFNATKSMLLIWFIVVVGLVALYECLRFVIPLICFSRHLLRTEMLALLLSSVYPHYYGWWGLIGYVNEDFYAQWKHQVFFTLTELASTAMVVHLCTRNSVLQPWKLLVIFDINMTHVVVASLDQFIANVIYREGQHFEAVRDLALMAPDVFHLLVAYFEMSSLATKRRTTVYRLFYREELLFSLVIISLLSLLGKSL